MILNIYKLQEKKNSPAAGKSQNATYSYIYPPFSLESTELQNDNSGCIQLCSNPTFSVRSRHIETKYHYIRGQVAAGNFVIKKSSTHDTWNVLHNPRM